MKQLDTPKVTRAPALPLVWVVPLLALAIGGWMILREYLNHGPEITIEFASAPGVVPGKTMMEYKGVTVGEVQKVELEKDLKNVLVTVRLNTEAAALACEGTQIWIVHPEFGLSGVSGLDTLVTGAYLAILPGTGPSAKGFKGIDQPPPPLHTDLGRAYFLQSNKLGGITAGSPVKYRDIKVGEVEASQLSDDSTQVVIRVRVYTPYVELVRANAQFWNAGGISVKVGLLGAQINTTSLESILAGGVAFAIPDGEPAPLAQEGTHFALHEDAPKDWATWQPKISGHSPESSPPPSVRKDQIPFLH